LEILRKDMNNWNNKVFFLRSPFERGISHIKIESVTTIHQISILFWIDGADEEWSILSKWQEKRKGETVGLHPHPHPPPPQRWRQIYIRLYGRQSRLRAGIRRALHEFRTYTSYFVCNICLERKNCGRFYEKNALWFCKINIQYHFYTQYELVINISYVCFLVVFILNCDITLILLTWRIWWAPNNASRWQMGLNSAFKGLNNRRELVRIH
jgi:hypothetical protein